jgi:molecular chaperone Hsp33
LCALGARVGERVLSSGGLLIQPLPGCSEQTITDLEARALAFSNISGLLERESPEQLVNSLFDGMDPVVLSSRPLAYQCDCSRERMERALISMGRDELQLLIEEQGGAELVCHFCRSAYAFDAGQLRVLMKEQD